MARLATRGYELQDAVAGVDMMAESGFGGLTPPAHNGTPTFVAGVDGFGKALSVAGFDTLVMPVQTAGRVYYYRTYAYLPPGGADLIQFFIAPNFTNSSGQFVNLGAISVQINGPVSRAGSNGGIIQYLTASGVADAVVIPGQVQAPGLIRNDYWHLIELRVGLGAGSTTTVQLRIDGADITLLDNNDLITPKTVTNAWFSTMPDRIAINGWADMFNSQITGDGAAGVYYDNVAINDNQGASETSWCGPGQVWLLRPASDNARGANWTTGAAGTTNLWDALNNTPPVGTASPGGATSQIKNAAKDTTGLYTANMETYTAVGIPTSHQIKLVQGLMVGGSSAAAALAMGVNVATNPVIAETVGNTPAVAIGAHPTNWVAQRTAVSYAPTVTRGTAPTMSVRKNTSSTNAVHIEELALIVETTPQPHLFLNQAGGKASASLAVTRPVVWTYDSYVKETGALTHALGESATAASSTQWFVNDQFRSYPSVVLNPPNGPSSLIQVTKQGVGGPDPVFNEPTDSIAQPAGAWKLFRTSFSVFNWSGLAGGFPAWDNRGGASFAFMVKIESGAEGRYGLPLGKMGVDIDMAAHTLIFKRGVTTQSVGMNIADGRFHHIMGVYDGTTFKGYVDFVEVASFADSTNLATSGASFNQGSTITNSSAYDGKTQWASRVAIWEKALSTTERNQLRDTYFGLVPNPASASGSGTADITISGPAAQIVPLAAASGSGSASMAFTVPTVVPHQAAAASSGTLLALTAPTTVALTAASASSSGTLAATAVATVPLAQSAGAGSTALALRATALVQLAAASGVASASMAATASTLVPLTASSGSGSAALALAAPTRVALGAAAGSAAATASITVLATVVLSPAPGVASGSLTVTPAIRVALAPSSATGAGSLALTAATTLSLAPASAAASGSLAVAAAALVLLNGSSSLGTASFAITAPARLSLATSSAVASATLSLSAPASVLLGGSSGNGVGALAITAATRVPLAQSAAAASGALSVTSFGGLALATAVGTATGSLAISATTRLPLASASATGSATLGLSAATGIGLSPASGVSSASAAFTAAAKLALSSASSTATGALALSAASSLTLSPSSGTGSGTLDVKIIRTLTLTQASASSIGSMSLAATTLIALDGATATAFSSATLKAPTTVLLDVADGAGAAELTLTARTALGLGAAVAVGTGQLDVRTAKVIQLGPASATGSGALVLVFSVPGYAEAGFERAVYMDTGRARITMESGALRLACATSGVGRITLSTGREQDVTMDSDAAPVA